MAPGRTQERAKETIIGLVRLMLARDNREIVKLRSETKPDSRTSLWLTNRHRQELIEAIDTIDGVADQAGAEMAEPEIVRVKG